MTAPAQTQNETEHVVHRTPAQYVLIGAILVVLTTLEIILYYMEDSIQRTLLVASLLGLAALKFFLVAAYFMHLKDDPKLFRRWFIIGGLSALTVFAAVLASLSIQDFRFF